MERKQNQPSYVPSNNVEGVPSGRGGSGLPTGRCAKRIDNSEDEYDDRRIPEHKLAMMNSAADAKTSRPGSASYAAKKEVSPSGESQAKHSHSIAEEKQRLIEIQQEIEADEEFEKLKKSPTIVVPSVGKSFAAQNFSKGFRM
jgi:hypothetical protein